MSKFVSAILFGLAVFVIVRIIAGALDLQAKALQFGQKISTLPVEVLRSAGVIVAALAAIAAIVLWLSLRIDDRLRGLFDTPVDPAVRTSRAYVLPQSITFQRIERLDAFKGLEIGVEATMLLKNLGQTPAHDLTASLIVAAKPSGETLDFPVQPDGSHSRAPLGQNVTASLMVQRFFTPNDFAAIERGERTIYAWGQANYRDEYGNARRTTYRYVAVYNEQHRAWTFAPDRNGNASD